MVYRGLDKEKLRQKIFLVLGDIYAHFDKYTMLSGDRQFVFLEKIAVASFPEKKSKKSPKIPLFLPVCPAKESGLWLRSA